jgi:hypothetical protein
MSMAVFCHRLAKWKPGRERLYLQQSLTEAVGPEMLKDFRGLRRNWMENLQVLKPILPIITRTVYECLVSPVFQTVRFFFVILRFVAAARVKPVYLRQSILVRLRPPNVAQFFNIALGRSKQYYRHNFAPVRLFLIREYFGLRPIQHFSLRRRSSGHDVELMFSSLCYLSLFALVPLSTISH